MTITIDSSITDTWSDFAVGVLSMSVRVYHNSEVTELVHTYEKRITSQYDISEIVQLPIIKDGRDAYKAFGKDPSRYRLAVESLYRRLAKGNTLYRINNVVDIGNIASIETRKSVAVLDQHQIEGDIVIRLGRSDDHYQGIGRGSLNIDRIPLYEDSVGPFGSTTSDTERTMITDKTIKVLLFIISFSGKEILRKDLEFTSNLYQEFCDAVVHDLYIV